MEKYKDEGEQNYRQYKETVDPETELRFLY